ncbi:MAG: hypothetical protein GX675_07660 [Erysipelotrichaceae bacterium]|nr:hypothetical protein [Erysipelotrichaceae bacterium]
MKKTFVILITLFTIIGCSNSKDTEEVITTPEPAVEPTPLVTVEPESTPDNALLILEDLQEEVIIYKCEGINEFDEDSKWKKPYIDIDFYFPELTTSFGVNFYKNTNEFYIYYYFEQLIPIAWKAYYYKDGNIYKFENPSVIIASTDVDKEYFMSKVKEENKIHHIIGYMYLEKNNLYYSEISEEDLKNKIKNNECYCKKQD